MNTAAGSTSRTPSKAPKDSAPSSVQKGKTRHLEFFLFEGLLCFEMHGKALTKNLPLYNRYNVGCTKRMGLFRPERNKPANRWRRKSQGRTAIEAKKQVSGVKPLPSLRLPFLMPPGSQRTLASFSSLSDYVSTVLKGTPSARRPV